MSFSYPHSSPTRSMAETKGTKLVQQTRRALCDQRRKKAGFWREGRAANEWTKKQWHLNEPVQNVGLKQLVLMGGDWEAKTGQERRAAWMPGKCVCCYYAVLILWPSTVIDLCWMRREWRWSQRGGASHFEKPSHLDLCKFGAQPVWLWAQVNMPVWCEEEWIIPCKINAQDNLSTWPVYTGCGKRV